MSYDSACFALAQNFLQDEEWAREQDVEELAQDIQNVIEDYLAANRPEEEKDEPE